VEIILSHNNADFDAVASQLAAWKLNPQAVPVLSVRLNPNVSEFITLYRAGLPFVNWHDARFRHISRIILTDTQDRPAFKGARANTPTLIVDHHPLERDIADHETWMGAALGAATTLLVEEIQQHSLAVQPLEATLMALGIYADTGMLTYASTTPRDLLAAAWLLQQGAHLDTLRRFLAMPLTDAQQRLYQALVSHAELRTVHGHVVAIAKASISSTVEGINGVTERLTDALDTAATIVIVRMPRYTQVVARSTADGINVGDLLSALGGGGHPRAAAVSLEDTDLDAVAQALWERIASTARPVASVSQLMSFGVQTVAPDDALRDVVTRLRRIGHEGYPVVQDGQVIGLLTRRDADRALEHGLAHATVREVMQAGDTCINPDAPVTDLEQLMVSSGWGQIPVVDEGRLVGIVTRTDLLKYWVNAHAQPPQKAVPVVPPLLLERLNTGLRRVLEHIAQEAQQRRLSAFVVGGVVRDLLLERENHDVDIVIEHDAIAFAHALQTRWGGTLASFAPFGTARWTLDEPAMAALGAQAAQLPLTIDFATARNEFYTHPTALPTVYSGSIKLDMGRRDFSINAMAVQISPAGQYGRLIDYFDGLQDLRAGQVRVLHSLSFVDDPTRILRAVRFARRYSFSIEPRTLELLHNARPLLARITGERLRNELDLMLAEAAVLDALQDITRLSIDRAMHPEFVIGTRALGGFQALQGPHPAWANDEAALRWHLLLADTPLAALDDVMKRFLLPETIGRQIRVMAVLGSERALASASTRPSQVVALLERATPVTWLALWLLGEPQVRQHLEAHTSQWCKIYPRTNGDTLRQMGLPPGPLYSRVLRALRNAWLDGEVNTAEEETALLRSLLENTPHDDV
jgi:tRNA nucleotidyltransferase (CCA-adding enzyme)